MNNTLKKHAHSLRLSGLLESLDLRLQEAEANRLPYAQFLELLLHLPGKLFPDEDGQAVVVVEEDGDFHVNLSSATR